MVLLGGFGGRCPPGCGADEVTPLQREPHVSSDVEVKELVPEPPPVPVAAVTPERVLAGLSLLVPIVALLWVSSYAKTGPKLGGVPFFYWYQLLWVPVSAVFTVTAYLLITRDEKARKAGRAGGAR